MHILTNTSRQQAFSPSRITARTFIRFRSTRISIGHRNREFVIIRNNVRYTREVGRWIPRLSAYRTDSINS